jgi:O-antigen/teichoic acid export membrane protein
MINAYNGAKYVGLYSIGYNVGMLLLLGITAIQVSLFPDFFKYFEEKNYNKLSNIVGRMFSFIFIFGFFLILFGGNILSFIADPKFHSGINVIPPIVIGYLFYGLFVYHSNYVTYSKKTIYLTVSTLVAGILNILLNIYYIPRYGYLAAAYTTFVSYLILFVIIRIIVKYILKMKIVPIRIFIDKLLCLTLIMIIYYTIQNIENSTLILLLKLISFGVFSILLFYKEIISLNFGNLKNK